MNRPSTHKKIFLTLGILLLSVFVFYFALKDDPAKATREKFQQSQQDKNTSFVQKSEKRESGLVQPESILPDGTSDPDRSITQLPDRPGLEKAPASDARKATPPIADIPEPPPVPENLLRPRLVERKPEVRPAEMRIAPQRYLFQNLAPEALQAQSFSTAKSIARPRMGKFAPQGESIQLVLMDTVISNRHALDVVAGVWEPLVFQGRKLLDFGDKLLGRASAGKFRNRLEITFYKVVFKDGRSFPIQAVAQDTDGTLGIPGKQVGSSALHAVAPILLDMASAFSNSFKNRVLVGVGTTSQGYTTASGGIQEVPDLQNAAITGSQGGIQKIQSLVAEEIEEHRPYLVLPAGTRCRALLTQLLDISHADYGK